MAPDPDKSNLLDNKSTKIIQSIVGTFLYYARSVDPKMLQEINEISRVQSKPTKDAETKATVILYYAATYPNAVICYKASNMVLYLDLDAEYITISEARSCYA